MPNITGSRQESFQRWLQRPRRRNGPPQQTLPLSAYQAAAMALACQRAGIAPQWLQAITASANGAALAVHLPCGCRIAVRHIAPGNYVATNLPQKYGRHPKARYSERRIRATDVYHATALAVANGKANCIAKAKRNMTTYLSTLAKTEPSPSPEPEP